MISKSRQSSGALELTPPGPDHARGIGHQSSRSLPDFHRFDHVHHATPVLISPGESRNRQELVSVKLKQPLDECKLQDFRRDEDDGTSEEMTGSDQIGRQGLCRLQDDEWHGKKRERWIRPQRNDPESHSLEKFFLGKPYRYRLRDVRKHPVYDEVRCSKDESERVPDASHESSAESKRRRSMRSSSARKSAANAASRVPTGAARGHRPAFIKPQAELA